MNRIYALALLVLGFSSGCASLEPQARVCYHRDAADETDIGYCEAVRVGNTLHVSGTAGKGDSKLWLMWNMSEIWVEDVVWP